LAERSAIALVGSDSLLGREIRDIAAVSGGLTLRLIAADDEAAGKLTRVGDEPAVVTELTAENLSGARAIVLAGSTESSRRAIEIAVEDGAPLVDLTYAAEDLPEARLRAPAVEGDLEDAAEGSVHVIAHPAAIAMAIFLRRLQSSEPVRRSIVHVLAPASEQGERGVMELQEQTVSLLSFKSVPRAIFDTQISFNLVARYGEEAPVKLEDAELRMERHLATLLDMAGEGEGAPMPSLRLIQAPVFHGYSFSIWVEFENDPGADTLEGVLSSELIDVRAGDQEPPTNVGQAGQSGISVGAIAPDRNHPDAYWFWVVADNLRLQADNAVAVVRQLA
jgi:aspartate-semialdehyde dehydrogenase